MLKSHGPALMHRYPPEGAKSHSKSARLEELVKDCEVFAYRSNGKNSELYFPSVHLHYAIREGARFHKINRRAAWPIVEATIRVMPEKLMLGTTSYEAHVETVMNKTNGTRFLVARPKIEKWEVEAQLEIQDDLTPVGLIKDALVDGGRVDGLGANRKRFGRFSVETWEVQE